jgi:hypothetical protein
MTVQAVISIYCVRKSYVYRMASEHHWRRYRHPDGGVRYRWEDVDDTLSGGAAGRHDRASGKVRD